MVKPTFHPKIVEGTLSGLGMQSHTIHFGNIPKAARVTTSLAMDNADNFEVKIVQVTVFRVQTEQIPVSPFRGELPPGVHDEPGSTSPVQKKVVIRQSDGNTPVLVEPGQFLEIDLVAGSISPSFNRASGRLVVAGDTWDPITVPLSFVRQGEVSIEFDPNEMTVSEGRALTKLTVRSVAGPTVDLKFQLIKDFDATDIDMEPAVASLRIGPGEAKSITLAFRVAGDASGEERNLRIEQSGGIVDEHRISLRLQPALTLPPGFSPPVKDPSLTTGLRERLEAERAMERKHSALGGARTGVGTQGMDHVAGGFIREFFRGRMFYNRAVADEAFFVGRRADQRYKELGGPRSFLGWPISDDIADPVEAGSGVTRFQNGAIYWWRDHAAMEMRPVSLRYVGLHCFGETDEVSESDEPYFTFGIVPTVKELRRVLQTRIYDDVDAGESRPDDIELYRGLPLGAVLSITLAEHDEGDPDKYKAEVEAAVEEASDLVATAIGMIPVVGPVLGPLAKVVLKVAGPAITDEVNDLLGTDDDQISAISMTVTPKQMMQLTRIGRTNFHGIMAHIESELMSGGGASYKAYFAIEEVL